MATPTTHCYQTHFYCAICGGPFAEVFRTAVERSQPRTASGCEDTGSECMSVDPDDEQRKKDLDLDNEFNIPPERNFEILREELNADMGTGAAYVKSLRLKAEAAGQRKGYATEHRATRHAYDGKLISVSQMEWTKSLRALIHKNAKKHPVGSIFEVLPGPDSVPANPEAYRSCNTKLTGKGQIRKHYCWADAYADFEQEGFDPEAADDVDEPENGDNLFNDSQIRSNRFGFNVYQELANKSVRDALASISIPFHADCWDLLNLAIEIAMKDRGVVFSVAEDDAMDDLFSHDELWDTLAQLIGEASNEKNHFNYPAVLQDDPSQRGEVVTKLGLVDYRHSESCNEGWRWRHEDGLHWVVAEPTTQATLVRRENDIPQTPAPQTLAPILYDNREDPLSDEYSPYRPYNEKDPFAFHKIPKELIHMIFRYMSSTDVYSFRAASRWVHDCDLPQETYRRFLSNEFKYIPLLQLELQKTKSAEDKRIDYKGTFEWIRRSMRTPRPETALLFQTEHGRDWDDIDIGLKNRHRIWKIVCPIAESFAETSSQVLLSRHNTPQHYQDVYETYSEPLELEVAKSIHVPKGYFGRISGGEGGVESAYWGWEGTRIVKIRLFLTAEDGNVCGIRFYGQLSGDPQPFQREIRPGVILESDDYPKLRYRFGRMGPAQREFPPGVGNFFGSNEIFRGFDVQFKDGIISSFRPIIDNYGTAWCGPSSDEHDSRDPQGGRAGVVRNMTVHNIEKLVGVAGFINSRGCIETFGLIEKGPVSASASDLIKRPSEPEFSAWKKQPPAGLSFNRRVGVKLYNWRTAPCEWEIWDHRSLETEKENSDYVLAGIHAYVCSKFLRGLVFKYENIRRGTVVYRHLGSTSSDKWTELVFGIDGTGGERVLGAVIAESTEGIHSLLLATSNKRRSPSFGPPYLGAHRVFIDNTHVDHKHGHHYTNIYRLTPPIIGLHCIYDHEAERFLQLGLIESNAEGMVTPSVTTPYSIYSELGGLSTWIDTPLPTPHTGSGDRTMHIGCRDLRTNSGDHNARFASWIDFENLRRIEIFGDMAGIRFTYKVEAQEKLGGFEKEETIVKIFGDTTRWSISALWNIGPNERVAAIGVRRKTEQGTLLRAATKASGPFNPKAEYFPEFATNPSTLNACTAIIESRFLTGLKFLFSAKKITYWVPLFSNNPNDPKDILNHDLIHTYKCPWRQYHDIEYSINRDDGGIPSERSGYIITRYGNGNTAHNRVIDRVRAYISIAGNFSGLVFSRNGRWETEVFGMPTGIEFTLNLPRGENFDSMWVSYADLPPHMMKLPVMVSEPPRPVVAIALVTNKGRVTPWFGEPQGKRVLKAPSQAGLRMVGITGELKTHSDPMWRDMYILQRPEPSTRPSTNSPPPSPPPNNLHFGPRRMPANRELEHLHDHSLLPNHFITHQLQRVWVGDAVNAKGLTYTIFNPDQLQFVSIYSKKPSTNYGILGIGFEGAMEMGAVVVGSVPDENEIEDGRVGTLAIDAANGERITSVVFAYGLGLESDNILALSFHTSSGSTLTHNAKGVTFDLLALASQQGRAHRLICPPGHEIIGFQALVRTRGKNIHDLALITREMVAGAEQGKPLAGERPMDELAKRNSVRGWSPKSGFGGGGRYKRSLSGAGGVGGAGGAGGVGEMSLRSRKVARKG